MIVSLGMNGSTTSTIAAASTTTSTQRPLVSSSTYCDIGTSPAVPRFAAASSPGVTSTHTPDITHTTPAPATHPQSPDSTTAGPRHPHGNTEQPTTAPGPAKLAQLAQPAMLAQLAQTAVLAQLAQTAVLAQTAQTAVMGPP
ncbi:hypothetical protein Apa02nite_001720 [Actinoplanes palleronii]|uniref:Uncharacterized protein n=1 Tax=Actinoplanes palleronii TaxID=113570 RepID=A0ABQ4B053_9ACTN|nr:hypothetical protein Apa02nite_001720 [Actinoplanes palleronii]